MIGKDLDLPFVCSFAQCPLLLEVAQLLERVQLELGETLGVRLKYLHYIRQFALVWLDVLVL